MVVEVEKPRYIYSVLRSCFSQPGAVIQDSLLHDLESLWWAFRFYSAITISNRDVTVQEHIEVVKNVG